MTTKWPEVRLGEVCDVQIGKTPPRARPEYWGPGHPWLSISDMNQGRDLLATAETITDRAVADCNGRLVEPGTVLLSFKLSVGKVGIARRPMYTNEAIAHLPARDPARLDATYLMRALQRADLASRVDRAAMGATLNKAKLNQVTIPLPPIEEQRRIATILDQTDELRAKRRASLALLGSLTESIFVDMFGNRQSNPWALPLHSLGDLVDPSHPITRGIDQPGPDVEDGVPYIKTTDFGVPLIRENLARAAPAIAAKFPRSVVSVGDSVICIRATVGPVLLVSNELGGVNLSRGTARVSPRADVHSLYLHGALRSQDFQNQIKERLRGATFLQIPLTELRKLQVMLPSVEAQFDYARRVLAASNSASSVKSSSGRLDDLFGSLQHRAFAGAL